MIDHTSSRIEQQERATVRHNRRRYAFHRMLKTTDRILWRLEEMNRDGVKTVPKRVRAEFHEAVDGMPEHVREPFRDTGVVQEMLDSMFEIQERLFRWRYPDWHDFDPDFEQDEKRLDFVAS
jgi:GTP cyclohydrolase I